MAIADFIPQVWAAGFLRILDANRVWVQRANREYQGEISAYGSVVKVPSYGGVVNVRDYTPNTNLTDPEDLANGNTADLVIDQSKSWRVYVDDIHAAQSRPDLMTAATTRGGVAMAKVQETFARGLFVGGIVGGRSIDVAGALSLEATVTGILKAFTATYEAMSNADIPEENRWAIVNPRLTKSLTDYFITRSAGAVFAPATAEGLLQQGAGYWGRLCGFNVFSTSNTPAAASKDQIVCSQGNYAVSFAEQISSIEAYRPELRHGDAVKALHLYGGLRTEDTSIYAITTAQA